MSLAAWMRYTRSNAAGVALAAVLVAAVVAVVVLLARWWSAGREGFSNYRECRDARCGGRGKGCDECKSGNWKNAGGGDAKKKEKGDKKDEGGAGKADAGSGGWRKAQITCYAPTNRFAFSGGTSSNMVAVHEKDKEAYAGKKVEIKWPDGTTKVLRVGDYCADKDCKGCCTRNANANGGFLLDVNKNSLPGGVKGDPCWAGGSWRVVG